MLDCLEHLKLYDLSSPFYNSDVLNKFIEYRNFKEEERMYSNEEENQEDLLDMYGQAEQEQPDLIELD